MCKVSPTILLILEANKLNFFDMIIKRAVPNLFTCLGLLVGCISIVCSNGGELNWAGYFIIIAAVFDFLDGQFARLFNAITDFGKQLDSLADVVSFGVAPSMILYKIIMSSLVESAPGSTFDIQSPGLANRIILYSAFLVTIFSALRLAKFNTDNEQEKSFKGLPTPANALLIAAIGFISENSQNLPVEGIIYKLWFLLILVGISCFLLVSPIKMFSLKMTSFRVKENSMRYIFLIFSVVLLIVFRLPGLAAVILLYLVMSLINTWLVKMP